MSAAPKSSRTVAWIAVGVGAFFVVVTILAVVIETRRVVSGKSADATVVKCATDTGPRDSSKAVIQFRIESGDLVEAKYPSSLKFDRPSIGEHLAVVYDPSNPARVVAKEFSFRARTYGVLLAFAAVWMIPAVTTLRRQRQQRGATQGHEERTS